MWKTLLIVVVCILILLLLLPQILKPHKGKISVDDYNFSICVQHIYGFVYQGLVSSEEKAKSECEKYIKLDSLIINWKPRWFSVKTIGQNDGKLHFFDSRKDDIYNLIKLQVEFENRPR